MEPKHISAIIIGVITLGYVYFNKGGDLVALIGVVAMCTILGGC